MCVESSESKYGALASTCIYAIDVSTLCTICLFLRFVSNDAFIVLGIFNFVGFLGCVISLLVFHESPKWLVMKHRTQEAIVVINKIAKFNGSNSDPLSLDTLIFVDKESLEQYLKSEKCFKEIKILKKSGSEFKNKEEKI